MPRPPAPDGTPTKPFVVKEGFSIGGFDGERKDEGDIIELTRAQAEYFQELGAITFDMGAVFDGPPDDTAKAVPEPKSDEGGDAGVGEPPAKKPAPKKRAPSSKL